MHAKEIGEVIHTCFKCHRAIAYEGDDCPVCELILGSSVLVRYIKTLEREIEELREMRKATQ
jgi:hypothetical protein